MEAQKGSKPAGKGKKSAGVTKTAVTLGKINAVYRLERTIKDLSPSEKYQQRQKIAKPLLDDFKS